MNYAPFSRAQGGPQYALDFDGVDRALKLRLPGDVRHLPGAGLFVGGLGPLGDYNGKDALLALRVQGDNAQVGSAFRAENTPAATRAKPASV